MKIELDTELAGQIFMGEARKGNADPDMLQAYRTIIEPPPRPKVPMTEADKRAAGWVLNVELGKLVPPGFEPEKLTAQERTTRFENWVAAREFDLQGEDYSWPEIFARLTKDYLERVYWTRVGGVMIPSESLVRNNLPDKAQLPWTTDKQIFNKCWQEVTCPRCKAYVRARFTRGERTVQCWKCKGEGYTMMILFRGLMIHRRDKALSPEKAAIITKAGKLKHGKRKFFEEGQSNMSKGPITTEPWF